MLDNDLIRLFIPIISAGLISAGFAGVTIQQDFQPTRQGVPVSSSVVAFHKISDYRRGARGNTTVFEEQTQTMVTTEIQPYETTFQVSGLLRQNPSAVGYTASDLINTVAQIMQQEKTLTILNDANVGILKIGDIRNPYFFNDHDQNTASASFDFTLTHNQIFVTSSEQVTRESLNVYRV